MSQPELEAGEPDLDAIWDPHPLQVGDRVRVRLGGECELHPADPCHFHGQTGYVLALVPDWMPSVEQAAHVRGHIYHVRLDHPFVCERETLVGSMHSRAELERI